MTPTSLWQPFDSRRSVNWLGNVAAPAPFARRPRLRVRWIRLPGLGIRIAGFGLRRAVRLCAQPGVVPVVRRRTKTGCHRAADRGRDRLQWLGPAQGVAPVHPDQRPRVPLRGSGSPEEVFHGTNFDRDNSVRTRLVRATAPIDLSRAPRPPPLRADRWTTAVPSRQQALRGHLDRNHHEPSLRRVPIRVRRPEDDHGLARPPHPSLQHHRDRQRELALHPPLLNPEPLKNRIEGVRPPDPARLRFASRQALREGALIPTTIDNSPSNSQRRGINFGRRSGVIIGC